MSSLMGNPKRSKLKDAGNYDSDTRAGDIQVARARLAGIEDDLAALRESSQALGSPAGAVAESIRHFGHLRDIYRERIRKYGGIP